MGIAVAPGRHRARHPDRGLGPARHARGGAEARARRARHDACYLPRNRHVTGDIAVHDLAFAGGELWLVATAFSCLATLDADHSFVPRWTPPFISAAGARGSLPSQWPGGREDRVAYVTALGTTRRAGRVAGWKGRRRGAHRRRLLRGGHRRALDAPFAALAPRPSVAARVRQGHAVRRPTRRRPDRRGRGRAARLHPRPGLHRRDLPSSGSRRSASPRPSATCP